MKMIKIGFLILVLNLFSVFAMAKIGNVPTDLTKLSGAFTGKTSNTHRNVRTIIMPKAQKPGTFIVATLINDAQGIIFDGELISGSQNIGLSALGLNQDESEIEVTVPPAALMQVVGDHIEIVPQAGSQVMNESIILDKQVSDVSFAPPLPGEYGGTSVNHVSVGSDGYVKIQAPAFLNGQFMSTVDIAGIGVLRGVSFDANYQSRETERVSGLLIGLVQGGKSAILLCASSSDGKPATILMFKKR